MNKRIVITLASLYVGSIVLANVVTSYFHLVPAWWGLMVPAGTYAAGLALGLRDVLQEAGGIRVVAYSIAAGAVVSAMFGDWRIALASGFAFAVSETLDLAVYTPMRARYPRWVAIGASNVPGAAVDTLLFLAISGLGLTGAAFAGQLLVKAGWVTALFVVPGFIAWAVRRIAVRHRVPAVA